MVSRAWRCFGQAKGATAPLSSVGQNDVEVCEPAEGPGVAKARVAAEGIRAVPTRRRGLLTGVSARLALAEALVPDGGFAAGSAVTCWASSPCMWTLRLSSRPRRTCWRASSAWLLTLNRPRTPSSAGPCDEPERRGRGRRNRAAVAPAVAAQLRRDAGLSVQQAGAASEQPRAAARTAPYHSGHQFSVAR